LTSPRASAICCSMQASKAKGCSISVDLAFSGAPETTESARGETLDSLHAPDSDPRFAEPGSGLLW
jgi:hypothetical protein